MMKILSFLILSLTHFFDLLLYPFSNYSPWIGLCAMAVLTGILILVVFRLVSNQEPIRRIKARIKAHFLEIRLYKHDLGLMMIAQMNILKNNLIYMRYAFLRMLFVIVPVLLIIMQLNLRFDRRPLKPGEATILKVVFSKGAVPFRSLQLLAPEEIKIETPPIFIPSQREVSWRLKVLNWVTDEIKIIVGLKEINKAIVADSQLQKISTRRVSTRRGGIIGFWDLIIYSAEPPLDPRLGIESVQIGYPKSRFRFLGKGIHWLVVFFLVSILTAFSLRKLFGVEI